MTPPDIAMNAALSELKQKLEDSDLLDTEVRCKKMKESDDGILSETSCILDDHGLQGEHTGRIRNRRHEPSVSCSWHS